MSGSLLSLGHRTGTVFQVLPLGAGGFCTGIDIALDGTIHIKTDTYGAYRWNGTQWVQLVTSASFPGANPDGVWDIRAAPSLSSFVLMIFGNTLYSSLDSGATWASANLTMTNATANGNADRGSNQKIAIDPNNPDVAYVGLPNGSTPNSGVYFSSNARAATPTWTQNGTITAPNANPGCAGICFDKSAGTVVVGGQTRTKRIVIPSGGRGVWESTDGGVTFNQIADGAGLGGPTIVWSAQMGADGAYWCNHSQTQIWSYISSAWTNQKPAVPPPGSGQFAAGTCSVDPNRAGRVVFLSNTSAQFSAVETLDNGVSWVHLDASHYVWFSANPGGSLTATDVPWLGVLRNATLSIGDMVFDPTDVSSTGKAYLAGGVGVWSINFPTTWIALPYVSRNKGIEQLVANDICMPAGASLPICGVWDRGIMRSPITSYPSDYYPSGTITDCWLLDYASADPTYVVGLVVLNTTNVSAYSTDSGATFQQFPTEFTVGASGGTIACASSTNTLVTCGQGSSSKIIYTKDGGSTWNACSGLPTGPSKPWSSLFTSRHRNIAADRVNVGTFIAYNQSDGIYKSTDSGDTWSLLTSTVLSNANGHEQFIFAPGNAGHLWFSEGLATSNGKLYKSTDWGATKSQIANIDNVYKMAFGATFPGASYPTLFIIGNVSSVPGIWRSTDAGVSWTQVSGAVNTISSLNTLDTVVCMGGDMNTYGRVYLGFNGSGFAYGDYVNG